MEDKNEAAPMTRPTLPGLVAEWKLPHGGYSEYCDGERAARQQCAAELSQAVALTADEVEAIRNANGCVELGLSTGPNTIKTLLALVTRLTAASDGGGKGEGNG